MCTCMESGRGVRRLPQRATIALLAEALHLTGADRAAFEAAAGGAELAGRAPHVAPPAADPLLGREAEVTSMITAGTRPRRRDITLLPSAPHTREKVAHDNTRRGPVYLLLPVAPCVGTPGRSARTTISMPLRVLYGFVILRLPA
jgi:hypothetical protein